MSITCIAFKLIDNAISFLNNAFGSDESRLPMAQYCSMANYIAGNLLRICAFKYRVRRHRHTQIAYSPSHHTRMMARREGRLSIDMAVHCHSLLLLYPCTQRTLTAIMSCIHIILESMLRCSNSFAMHIAGPTTIGDC